MRTHPPSRSIPRRLCVALFLLAAAVVAQAQGADTFTNPVLDTGPDPWVITWKGYYYMNATGANLTVWKTRDLSELHHAEKKILWTPEPGQSWSHDIWAPELHRWGNNWYIYFAADAGKNDTHRIYVVENPSDDPLEGQWTLKGKVSDTTDRWAIDVDLFELHGEHYMLWSGWRGTENGEQDIFIAYMSNPWTIDSPAHSSLTRSTYASRVTSRSVTSMSTKAPKLSSTVTRSSSPTPALPAGPTSTSSASSRPRQIPTCSILPRGRSSTIPSSTRIQRPTSSLPVTMASSNPLTGSRTGSSITPTRLRARAATRPAVRACSRSPGTPTVRSTWGRPSPPASPSSSPRTPACRSITIRTLKPSTSLPPSRIPA
jgi:hypothetical protein